MRVTIIFYDAQKLFLYYCSCTFAISLIRSFDAIMKHYEMALGFILSTNFSLDRKFFMICPFEHIPASISSMSGGTLLHDTLL